MNKAAKMQQKKYWSSFNPCEDIPYTGSIWERTQPTFCQVCKQWCNTSKKPETGVEFQTLDVYAHDLKNIQICFLPSEA